MSSTGSSSSAKKGKLKQRVNVSAIGAHIVQELELAGDTLSKWMAYRIAELMREAEGAEGESKRTLDDKVSSLILQLWEKRASLPGQVDPTERLIGAIKILEKLEERDSFFSRPRQPQNRVDEEASRAYLEVQRINLQLALVEYVKGIRANQPATDDLPQGEEEREFRKQMDALLRSYTQRPIFISSADKTAVPSSDIDILSENIRGNLAKAICSLEALNTLLAEPQFPKKKSNKKPKRS
jgi:hypothetical protein